jgi:3-oxoacyl-[acyl-carrier-protein] synthase II
VAVTGLGQVSPLGLGITSFFQGLAEGRCAISAITRFNPQGLDVGLAGEIPMIQEFLADLSKRREGLLDLGAERLFDLFSKDPKIAFALAAVDEAMENSGTKSLDSKTLLHLGASLETFSFENLVGAASGIDLQSLDRIMVRQSLRQPLDKAIRLIEGAYGRTGLALTNCSACAAGLQALGQAYRAVRDCRFDLAVAGGFDSLITPLGIGGFQLLGALATGAPKDGRSLCRPFDLDRCGLVLGEGAAAMVLEPLEKVLSEGRKIYAEILGYGASLDAYSLSAPDPSGQGAVRAMSAALDDAGLKPEDIDHLNSHGTGTLLNDPVEAAAIRRVFVGHWEKMPVTAVKSMIGHALAAAGALEAASCLMTLETGLIPPNVGLKTAASGCELDHVVGAARPFDGRLIMTNSFGFGGQNSVLIVGKPEGKEKPEGEPGRSLGQTGGARHG